MINLNFVENKVNFVFKVCSAEVRVEIQAWFLSGKKGLLKSWVMSFCFCNAVSNRENTDKTMKTLERQGALPVSTVSVEVQTELEPWSARCFFATFRVLVLSSEMFRFSEYFSYPQRCLDVQSIILIPRDV